MSRVLIGITVLFILFILFSWLGMGALKIITGFITMILSLLALGWLYLTGEFRHRRSLWMVTAFAAFIVCTVVSMLLGYPCPPIGK